METGDTFEHDEGWARVKRLIELAKNAPAPTLSPERRLRIRNGLLLRLEREQIEQAQRPRIRRRIAGAFVAGATTTLLAGLLLKLITGGGLPWVGPSSAELATQQGPRHSVAE